VALELAAARAALDVLPQLPVGTYLSINLSPRAALDPQGARPAHRRRRRRAGPRLVLELTEHEQVADYDALLDALSRPACPGHAAGLDDIGAGFASLRHVTRLRPTSSSSTWPSCAVHRDPAHRAVARALLAFARDLGAVLVAEGVEEAGELDELLRLGALVGQGFLLGRPARRGGAARLVPEPDGGSATSSAEACGQRTPARASVLACPGEHCSGRGGVELPGLRRRALIGFGATGEVWRAREQATGETVALKRLRPGASTGPAVAALRREASALSRLDTPHVVRLRAVVGDDDDPGAGPRPRRGRLAGPPCCRRGLPDAR
jgi:EAL domain-containing protein (putative c-di-GMP-specific phosphodiesterase class I)